MRVRQDRQWSLLTEKEVNSARRGSQVVCYGWAVTTDSRQVLLSKAADLIGRQKLASCLNISPALLDAWISGSGNMPDGKLMELALTMDKLSREEKQ